MGEPAVVEKTIEESSNRDSYQATKEEIEDSLEFIKAKLNPPEAPAKTKRASKEIKHLEEENIPAPPPADVVIPLPVVVPNKAVEIPAHKKKAPQLCLQQLKNLNQLRKNLQR